MFPHIFRFVVLACFAFVASGVGLNGYALCPFLQTDKFHVSNFTFASVDSAASTWAITLTGTPEVDFSLQDFALVSASLYQGLVPTHKSEPLAMKVIPVCTVASPSCPTEAFKELVLISPPFHAVPPPGDYILKLYVTELASFNATKPFDLITCIDASFTF